MTRSLAHRGPDDEEVVGLPGAALGARRLVLLDPEGGRQPMRCGSVWVAGNHEVYNLVALREELDRAGVTLRSRSDTEVIGRLYELHGAGAIERLRGMFGLAIWNEERRRLLLARDPMGQRSMYWAPVGEGLVFGTELRAVRQHPGVGGELDPVAVREYLLHDAVPSPRTILRGVHKLEPGELLTFEGGDVSRRRYWQLAFDAPIPKDPGAALDLLDERVGEATRLRLQADRPVGALLSGGIDSSLVVLAAERPLRTFALGYREPDFDESAYGRQAAAAAGADHREVIIGGDEAARMVPAILAHLDEPLADEGVIPMWLVSDLARRSVTAVLTGDGGDELFLGYPTFLADRVARALDGVGAVAAARALSRLAGLIPSSTGYITLDFQARRFAAGLPYDRLLRHAVWLSSVDPALQAQVASADLLAATADWDPGATISEAMAGVHERARSHADLLSAFYLRFFLADNLLVKADRATMAHALEPRAPLLDPEVVAVAAALPEHMKRRGTTLKWALRELARRRGLPRSLVRRKKKGFTAPTADWLLGPLKPWMLDLLSPAAIRRSGLLDPGGVARLVDEHLSRRVNHRKPLWSLLALRTWEETWG